MIFAIEGYVRDEDYLLARDEEGRVHKIDLLVDPCVDIEELVGCTVEVEALWRYKENPEIELGTEFVVKKKGLIAVQLLQSKEQPLEARGA